MISCSLWGKAYGNKRDVAQHAFFNVNKSHHVFEVETRLVEVSFNLDILGNLLILLDVFETFYELLNFSSGEG